MQSEFVDLYELLQISRSAEVETIRRVYRLLARRWHPDNARTGDALQFRAVHEAYFDAGIACSRSSTRIAAPI